MTVSMENLGSWIQKGFDLYKANLVPLITLSVVAFVATVVTLGILALPMYGAIILVVLKLVDQQKPSFEIGALFEDRSFWVQAILLFVAVLGVEIVFHYTLGKIPFLGGLLGMILGLAINIATMFSLFLIAERKMAFWPAVLASVDKVKANPVPLAILAVVSNVLGFLCCIGGIVLAPFGFAIMAYVYRDVFREEAAPAAAAPAPATPPAAGTP